MKIAYLGLGKMGLNMCLNLEEAGHTVFVWNRGEEGRRKGRKVGLKVSDTIPELLGKLRGPRIVWIMVSEKGVDEVLNQVIPLLSKGDIVVDGGNTFYEDTKRRAKTLKKHGLLFLDAGVSGGPGGARNGACVMVGGDKGAYEKILPLIKAVSAPNAYGFFGDHGAGHFVKMIHNGIEYGMMQALAEGFATLKKSPFKLKLGEVARIYNNKSVIESRLVGWLESAYKKFGEDLKEVSGSVAHTGEGEWTVKTSKKFGVPTPIIKDSFIFRVISEKKPSYTGKILSALRNQFGGHSAKG